MAYKKYYPYPVNQQLYQVAREEILNRVQIPQYIADNVDPTVNLYQTKKMCCPMHVEDTPSFVYHEEKNIWTCYGQCSRSGKVIDLHMIIHGIKNYYSAVMHFRQMYGAKYGLTFKDFFIYEGNNEVRAEDVLSLERRVPDVSKLLGKKDKSPSFLMSQIENKLNELRTFDYTLFTRRATEYDALFNYHRASIENLDDLLKNLKEDTQNARKG